MLQCSGWHCAKLATRLGHLNKATIFSSTVTSTAGLYHIMTSKHERQLAHANSHSFADNTRMLRLHLEPCLDVKYFPKFHYAKRRFPVTLKCRHIYGVLNVDKIKN
jgi:hypothetical protein